MTVQQKILLLLNKFYELGIDKQIGYNKFYLYSLITHSTAIEGSTVTEIENQLLFDQGISAVGRSMDEQLMNLDLKQAYEQSILYAKSHSDISVDMLKHLASLVMKNTGTVFNTALGNFSSAKGDLRLLNVTAGVGGKSYMNFSKVPSKLLEFCVDVNHRRQTINNNDVIEAYNISFDAHFQLVTIHPWVDGNGRMSRLIMNQLQYEFGLVPTKIEKQNKAKYIETLIATRENGDLQVFRDFMFNEHLNNIESIINEYTTSIENVNVPVNVCKCPCKCPCKS
jgi:Fic family protein